MVYALGGSLVAGSINLFSLGFAQETATRVGTQAVNGDWIVYPTVLTGERSLQFIGTDEPDKVVTALPNLDVLYLSNNQPLASLKLRRDIVDFVAEAMGLDAS